MAKKHTFEYVRQYFDDNDCKLLDEEYINNSTKMSYICSCGCESMINLKNFKKGRRCRKCGNRKISESNVKFSYKEIFDLFKDEGCVLLEKEYKHCKNKMNYICSCGNEDKITFESFSEGIRCKKCWVDKIKNRLKFPYDKVKKYFEKNSCVLLEKEYINARHPMKYICSCGEKSMISFYRFRQGGRCKSCGYKKVAEKMSGSNHYGWIEDREVVEKNRKLVQKIRNLLNNTLTRIKQWKSDKTYDMLGYTTAELEHHINMHPNWESIKDKKDFHIDHIFPVKAFLDYNIFDASLINCLDNLQPLGKYDNLSKHCKYDKGKFEEWLASKGF